MLVRAALLVADPFRKTCAHSPSIPSWAWEHFGTLLYNRAVPCCPKSSPSHLHFSLCVGLWRRGQHRQECSHTGSLLKAGEYKPIHCSLKQVLHTAPQKTPKRQGLKVWMRVYGCMLLGYVLLQLWWKELVLWERDIGVDADASCMHIFHLENVCEDTVCYTVCLAQEGETDGETV